MNRNSYSFLVFFKKYHEKWFARVTSVFQHLNQVLISVFVFRPNCKPAGRCRGWGLAIQVTLLIKIVNDIENFPCLGSLCSLDSCAAHSVHVYFAEHLSMTNEKIFFIINTKLLIVETISNVIILGSFLCVTVYSNNSVPRQSTRVCFNPSWCL